MKRNIEKKNDKEEKKKHRDPTIKIYSEVKISRILKVISILAID